VLAILGSTPPAAGTVGRHAEDLVSTDRGQVRGVVQDTFRLFQGIPYAVPPVGELRWRAPQPAARWSEPLDATAPRGACAQPPSSFGTPQSLNEDCLYLNVTTPRRAHRLPVMVWLHGGAYLNGNGAGYDVSRLAVEGDVVVVTINYRLGALGFLALPDLTAQAAEQTGGTFASRVGCAEPVAAADCLRRVPVADLLRAWPAGGGPVVGGRELPRQPAEALRTDRFHHVPLLFGSNLDEMRLFVSLAHDALGRPVTAAEYEQSVRTMYGARADEVLRRYPLAAYPTPSLALSAVQTDFGTQRSTCEHLKTYVAASARPHAVPVYAYQFVDRTAPPLVDVPNFDEGAEHAAELSFLYPKVFGRALSPAQEVLSSAMVRYWTNFARTGNPNGRHLPDWPRFRSPADVLSLGLGPRGVHPADISGPSNCAFWLA
jgi:para-nitrobenzyl esterase